MTENDRQALTQFRTRCGVEDCPDPVTHEVHFAESWFTMCTNHANEQAARGPAEGVVGVAALPRHRRAGGDRGAAQVITHGRVHAHVLLSDVGLTMNDLSEDERRILDVGIRCGALAVLQLDLGESMEQMRRGEGTVLVPRPEDPPATSPAELPV